MRSLSHGFLWLYGLHGLVSLANGAWLAAGGASLLLGTGLLSSALVLAAMVVFVALHAVGSLSKRVLLPPCLITAWTALGAMPLPLLLEMPARLATLGAIELASAALALRLGADRPGSGARAAPGSAWTAFKQMAPVTLLLVLPGLAVYAFLSADAVLRHFTAGFVELRTDGLYAEERIYERADQEVRLIAMVHVADPDFYATLFQGLPDDAVVLLEGVSDEQGLLPEGMDYSGLARELGLVAQGGALAQRLPRGARRADVDVSVFEPETLEVLAEASRVLSLLAQGDRETALDAYLELASREPDLETFLDDVLELRNAHLLRELRRALEETSLVVVPWGAAHMPGIEAGVLEMDFELVASRERSVIEFGAGERVSDGP